MSLIDFKKNTHAIIQIYISYISITKCDIYNILISIICGYFFGNIKKTKENKMNIIFLVFKFYDINKENDLFILGLF